MTNQYTYRGRHRLRRRPLKRWLLCGLVVVAAMATAAGTGKTRSHPAPAAVPVVVATTVQAAPADTGFLTAIGEAGIPTTGRETALLMLAQRGADSHTTDADLEQALRALFPDIDGVQAEKFVLQVRRTWPGDHDTDTDHDGR